MNMWHDVMSIYWHDMSRNI